MHLDRRLLQLVRPARTMLLTTVGLDLGAGALAVVSAWYLAVVLDRAFLGGATVADLAPAFLGLIASAAGRGLLTWCGAAAAQRAACRVKASLRKRLIDHLFASGPAWTEGERAGELASTVTEGVEAFDDYVGEYLPRLALSAGVPLLIAVFVLARDRLSGVLLLATAPIIPAFMWLVGSVAATMSRRRWLALGRLSAFFLEVIQGLPTLKLLGRARDQLAEISRVTDRFRTTTMEVLRVAFLSAFTLELVATLSTAVIAVQVGLRLLYGRLAFLDGIFILVLAPEFYRPLRRLGASFHSAAAAVASGERIRQLLRSPALARPGEEPTGPSPPPGRAPEIELHRVSVAYPGAASNALRDLSMTIGSGETVALVGPSGAGKSTVARLLLRFLEPDSGSITVDGLPLSRTPIDHWRARISWMPQHPHVFHATAAANIRIGRPDASDQQIEKAARRVHLHDVLADLPEGYHTLVGERAARLSGGEAQRMALARALVAPADVVILDEPGVHLDPELETSLQAGLRDILRGRSALVIAHSLGVARSADRILVLDGGQVVEQGTFDDLMARSGPFRRLATAGGHTG